jgi:hypothetical protein
MKPKGFGSSEPGVPGSLRETGVVGIVASGSGRPCHSAMIRRSRASREGWTIFKGGKTGLSVLCNLGFVSSCETVLPGFLRLRIWASVSWS